MTDTIVGEPTADLILCKWAERRYGLTGVTRVELFDYEDCGWSEYTPGEGHEVRITVFAGDQVLKHDIERESVKLTREVCSFAAWLLASGATA